MSLPSGYTKLEYIQSSGAQYIDTGFAPNQDTRVVCRAKLAVGSTTNWLFGARYSSSSKKFTFAASQSGYYSGGYGTSALTFSTDCNTDGSFTVDANKWSFTVTTDSFAETQEGAYSSFTSPVNLTLFAGNTNGTLTYGSATIYSCQIYDNGTLVRDFIPCKDASGIVGLWDDANGVFYANAGSGTFTAGPEVTPSYKLVDTNELDSAMTATANAIRAKTEDTAKITWDATRGFASAIAAILSGGAQFATGSIITPSSSYNTFEIKGIGFKPTNILLYIAPNVINNQPNVGYLSGRAVFIIYDSSKTNPTTTIKVDETEEEWEDEETGEIYTDRYPDLYCFANCVELTPTSDGFTIGASSSVYLPIASAEYVYIAWA